MPVAEVERFLARFAGPETRRYVLACSGGLDSVVLLHVAYHLPEILKRPLVVAHVHHGLNPRADDWARHVQHLAEQYHAPCRIHRVNVSRQGSLEAAAREARYRALSGDLLPGDVLLTAHHANDQAETVLLQLLRGSGVAGLGGMRQVAVVPFSEHARPLWRPLLMLERDTLEAYARAQELFWVEDDSNTDMRHARNFLRHRVLPLIRERWPQAVTVLTATAGRSQEASSILNQVAVMDLDSCRRGDGSLYIPALMILEPVRRANLLHFWLETEGFSPPDRRGLESIIAQVCLSREDGNPCFQWGGQEIRRYRDGLYALVTGQYPVKVRLPWPHRESPLTLRDGRILNPAEVKGQGVSLEAWRRAQSIEVGFRRGGERLRPSGAPHHRSLKNLFQEATVPPWVRETCPMLYLDGELVQVVGFWIADGFAAGPGEQGVWIT